jgi:ATP-dependent DNA helicase PIF1
MNEKLIQNILPPTKAKYYYKIKMSNLYAVKKGIVEGIYNTWEECRAQIDNFSGAQYKKFKTREEAEAYMAAEEPKQQSPSLSADGIATYKEDLSPEQQYAFDKYSMGQNIFITGPGGTGKSFLIKKIKSDLESKNQAHAVCALTGCAAVLLNCCAKTIHSWAGIGIASGAQEEIVAKVMKNKRTVTNWRSIKTLIVDEVSMMSVKIFEILDKVGRNARKQYMRPFGGIQLVFIGDFYQLPPVGSRIEPETCQFCFESPIWETTFQSDCHIQLKTLYRQTDPTYIKVLEDVRSGKLSKETVAILKGRTEVQFDEANSIIKPTKLFPRNADADAVNLAMYSKIKEEEVAYDLRRIYNMSTYSETGKPISLEYLARCSDLSHDDVEKQLNLYTETSNLSNSIKLKKGAVVMCLANLDTESGICNGSQGVITDFATNTGGQRIPIVKFLNGITMRIQPKVYQHDDYPKFGVEQIPLRLAWAFTIHKSQGVTLQIAEMDIGSRVFECGQTYVALSRVKNLEGLYLSSFDPKKIKTNPLVSAFYEKIPKEISVLSIDEKVSSEELKLEPELQVKSEVKPLIKVVKLDA